MKEGQAVRLRMFARADRSLVLVACALASCSSSSQGDDLGMTADAGVIDASVTDGGVTDGGLTDAGATDAAGDTGTDAGVLIADPTLLPHATVSEALDLAAYTALNVPSLAAGTAYKEPTSGVNVYKLTSSSFPTTGPSFGHDYFEGNYEVSQPYTGDGITRAVLVYASTSMHYLIDFTPGIGVTNARALTGLVAPNLDISFTFSNNPATPFYAYVLNGTTLRRIDLRTLAEAPGGGFPVANAGTSGLWLQQSADDAELVWMNTSTGPTTFHYAPASQTLVSHTDANINEPRIDRGGRYVAFTMNTPGNGLQMWDTQTDTIAWSSLGDPGVPFAHVADLQHLWIANSWNETYPFPFATATPAAGSLMDIWGPSVGNLPVGNGQWMQSPASGDQKDAWTVWNSYGSLDGKGGSAGPWLAPGGMVLLTVNGGTAGARLLGHPYSTQYTYADYAWPKLTADGRYVLFTSDMNGSGRYDLFLAEMPTR
jgi:hypothetical protein